MQARARIPGALILVAGLGAAFFLGATGSLGVQRLQTQIRDEAFVHELTGGGDARRGQQAFARYGCGACHQAPNRTDATGLVGPPLNGIATRAFLAGDQPNDPAHMMAWIQHPQAIQPGVGMPEMGVSTADARDLAAYLYTLKD
jgi:cytochrome c2